MDTAATMRRSWVLCVLLGQAATAAATAGPAPAGHGPAMPRLRFLHVELNCRTFQSTYILPLKVNLLPDKDPDGAFQAARSNVVTEIPAILSASALSADDTKNVVDRVAKFPYPKHPAVLDIA